MRSQTSGLSYLDDALGHHALEGVWGAALAVGHKAHERVLALHQLQVDNLAFAAIEHARRDGLLEGDRGLAFFALERRADVLERVAGLDRRHEREVRLLAVFVNSTRPLPASRPLASKL